MKCIICLKEKPARNDRGEHVIPKALGGSFRIDRVCKDCDNGFGGDADAGLVNHFKIEHRRQELNLRGHRGSVPDPLARILKTPFMKIDDPNHRLMMVANSVSGQYSPRTIPKVEFDVEVHPGNMYRIELKHFYVDHGDSDKTEVYVRSALRKKGVNDEVVLQRAWDRLAPTLESKEEQVLFQAPFAIKIGGHQFGLLKIAYEMAWYWLGDAWIDDPIAGAMRDLLTGIISASNPLQSAVFDDPDKILIVRGDDPRLIHAIYLLPFRLGYLVGIRLFDIFTAVFIITNNARNYTHPKSDAIIMSAVERRHEETTFYDLMCGRSGHIAMKPPATPGVCRK